MLVWLVSICIIYHIYTQMSIGYWQLSKFTSVVICGIVTHGTTAATTGFDGRRMDHRVRRQSLGSRPGVGVPLAPRSTAAGAHSSQLGVGAPSVPTKAPGWVTVAKPPVSAEGRTVADMVGELMERGWTVTAIAEVLGVRRDNLSRWYHGLKPERPHMLVLALEHPSLQQRKPPKQRRYTSKRVYRKEEAV